jgi:signal transduction histidine kinase
VPVSVEGRLWGAMVVAFTRPEPLAGDTEARLAGGTGLAGLKDRVEALGGRLVLHSPRGAGTSLRAELPLTAANDGVTSR